jgi:hypothetical protein
MVASGSFQNSYNQPIPTDFSKLSELVRDQEVGGSNPLSPNILSLTISIGYAALQAADFPS